MNDFFNSVRSFLLEYLPKQRCLSHNTIRSYRQTLNIFVEYLRNVEGLSLEHINFAALNQKMLLSFLDWLEESRNCCAKTRNQRLMALRSFFNYAGYLDCTQIALSITAKNIPSKNSPKKTVEYLSDNAMEALLRQPDQSKKIEYRNLFFMIFMYDTAARCSEMLSMKICDVHMSKTNSSVYLHGKGDKTRAVPVSARTMDHFKKYLRMFHEDETLTSSKNVFYTTIHGKQQPMSADTVALFMDKYGKKAAEECPEMPTHIHPHTLRHSRAMYLYHNGMPLPLLSDFLGHANIESTRIYAYADIEMKRKAMEKADIFRKDSEKTTPMWDNNEDMILKLSGLV